MNLIFILFLISLLLLIFYSYSCSRKKISEKTIWTYWEQGNKNIPFFIKMCVNTWKDKNPDHNIVIIDKENVYNYLCKKDLPPNWKDIDTAQFKSDFIRLALLEKYGGIWIDITTICVRPINSVFKQTKSLEGFVKSNTSVFESWFITGKKGSKIIKRWKNELLKVCNLCDSVKNINKSYFDGVDFMTTVDLGWYLTIHRVLLKLIQFDDDIRYLFYNDSNILEDDKVFLHYKEFSNDIDFKEKILEKNDDFINKVKESGTPILKFIKSGGSLINITEEEIINNKDSVLYKLFYLF